MQHVKAQTLSENNNGLWTQDPNCVIRNFFYKRKKKKRSEQSSGGSISAYLTWGEVKQTA